MCNQSFSRKPTLQFYQVFACLSVLAFFLWQSQSVIAQSGQTYYVATDGDDNNLGTLEFPFGTIQHAAYVAEMPGDTVYVRGGTYHEAIQFTRSGSAADPIRILAYPGENPVIDGEYLLPAGPPVNPSMNNPPFPPEEFVWEPLVKLRGSYIEFRGFEIVRSRGRGITVAGTGTNYSQNITVGDCLIEGSRNAGIIAIYTEDLLIERCHITDAGNFAPFARTAFELDWPVTVNMRSTRNATLRETRVHHNWGEGIAAGRDSEHITIEDNLVYNNFALQVYIHRSQHVTVTRNLLYHTNEPAYQRGGDPSQCIVINNENQFPNSLGVDDVLVRNNVVVGCRRLIASWGSGSNVPISNVTIEHNTLVNAYSNVNQQNAAAIYVDNGNLVNMTIRQNVTSQQGFLVAEVVGSPAVTFLENAWSSQPITAASGMGDWVGDPQLSNPNALLAPGEVEVNWYKPGPASPLQTMTMGPTEYIVNAETTGCAGWPMDGCPPETPVMLSPTGTIQEASPSFVWQEPAETTSYTFVLYSVDTSSIALTETYLPSICTSGLCTAQLNSAMLAPGNYRWLVQAHNEYGASPWSAVSP